MGRSDEKLIPADTPWLSDPRAQKLCAVLAGSGHQVYFVGGCVRNALLGAPVSDVDIATSAHPETVMALAYDAGLKPIPTGIEHGTVTVVVDGEPYEVTTFRRDIETDGRRAVVAFAKTIEEDARRRDFTMNALYATPDGKVVDPLGGLPDLEQGLVRFIDDADERIREDYLRILRFFRFHAWYGDPTQGLDPDALGAIADTLEGLETLSAERIGAEMKKLLSAPDPAPALAAMQTVGVLPRLLSGGDPQWIAMIVHFEQMLCISPDWITRLVALGGENPSQDWRLSKADAQAYEILKQAAFEGIALQETAYRNGEATAIGALLLQSALAETPPDRADLNRISQASKATFPIKAADLMPAYQGPALGQRLRHLEQRWIASDFKLSKKDLLNLPD